MADFEFHTPDAIPDAASTFSSAEEGRYLAGGQTLIPVIKQRLAEPSDLISLANIDELAGVAVDGGTLSIGAMTTHADVASSVDVKNAIPVLASLAAGIGDRHVRNRGTIGGSLANNDPAADYPAASLGLGATIHTDRRTIPADDFFQGMFTTGLEEGELITRVSFPKPERAAYQKFRHPASRYALVGVFVAQGPAGIRVAVTGAGQGVFRVADMEEALAANFNPAALDGIVVPSDDLNTDIHAAADYRAHLIGVLAKRAVADASQADANQGAQT